MVYALFTKFLHAVKFLRDAVSVKGVLVRLPLSSSFKLDESP